MKESQMIETHAYVEPKKELLCIVNREKSVKIILTATSMSWSEATVKLLCTLGTHILFYSRRLDSVGAKKSSRRKRTKERKKGKKGFSFFVAPFVDVDRPRNYFVCYIEKEIPSERNGAIKAHPSQRLSPPLTILTPFCRGKKGSHFLLRHEQK